MRHYRDLIVHQLTRRRGDRVADLLLRLSGGGALLAIVASTFVPDVAALMPFVLFTVWTNGPHSPVLPASHEPILMLYGLVFPPILVAAIGTAGIVFVEAINYQVYTGATDLRAFRGLRESRLVARLTRLFERSPFLTIVVCAVTPLPFWVARVLSVLARYSLSRHLVAIALGRFPRLWFIAALGARLRIPAAWLMAITAGSLVVAAALCVVPPLWSNRRRRRCTDSQRIPACVTGRS